MEKVVGQWLQTEVDHRRMVTDIVNLTRIEDGTLADHRGIARIVATVVQPSEEENNEEGTSSEAGDWRLTKPITVALTRMISKDVFTKEPEASLPMKQQTSIGMKSTT